MVDHITVDHVTASDDAPSHLFSIAGEEGGEEVGHVADAGGGKGDADEVDAVFALPRRENGCKGEGRHGKNNGEGAAIACKQARR